MTATFDTIDRNRLFDFLGYGPEDPSFLFMGQKEYSRRDYELENLRIRCKRFTFPRHDKDAALKQLAEGFEEHGHYKEAEALRTRSRPLTDGGKSETVGVWRFASMIVAAWRLSGPCRADGTWHQTWRDEYTALGRRDVPSDSFLGELYPLVRHAIDWWPPSYATVFPAYGTAAQFHSDVFPFGTHPPGPRELLLKREVVGSLREGAVVVCYGTGSKQEFWRRFERLFPPTSSVLNGRRLDWHVVKPGRIEVGLSGRGFRVAKIGFPWGQSSQTCMTEIDVPPIIESLRALTP